MSALEIDESAALKSQAVKVLILVVLSLVSALLLLNLPGSPVEDLNVGEVSPRDFRAPTAFEFEDVETTLNLREAAAQSQAPVYAYDPQVATESYERIGAAFQTARSHYAAALVDARANGRGELSDDTVRAIGREFLATTGIELAPEALNAIARGGFPKGVEESAIRLLKQFGSRYIIADRSLLPPTVRPVAVIQFGGDSAEEVVLESYESIWTMERAKQEIRDAAAELGDLTDDPWMAAAAVVARSTIRPNFSHDISLTRFRRQEASREVAPAILSVARGTSILREGDVVSPQQYRMLAALRNIQQDQNVSRLFGGLFLMCLVFYGTITRFATRFIRKFSFENRELVSLAILMALALALTRFTVNISATAASRGGIDLSPELAWYLVPIAGLTLLVRILMNSETALVFAVAASCLCGMLMDGQVLYTTFFVVSSVTAASTIGMDRNRRSILHAGVKTGLVNALFVVLVGLAQTQALDDTGATQTLLQPVWGALFALAGGFLSAFLVLALLPLFELGGFVTDLQLMELANLNHPLLRNLLLRAPGSYHHSVTVGSLSQAAAEAIGCNALLARVASYFHDIGKAVTPQYFVENYRGTANSHERLSPQQSARIIIDHVRNGGAIAKRYKLPQPIIDNIYMHHGTGLLYYFYRKAQEATPDVDIEDFRYPGPRPNTREAGIIHLADKVEAACRSIREPTPERIAAMIQKIVNSTLADGQLEECPLTLQDLYIIAETFQESILAIHHQRIEYPDTQEISSPVTPVAEVPAVQSSGSETVITLDLPPREGEEVRAQVAKAVTDDRAAEPVDYESVDLLPGGGDGSSRRGRGGIGKP